MAGKAQVRVWDPLVRISHWVLVAAFTIAYLSGGEQRLPVHAWAGYVIIALVLVRLIWGGVGTRYARFSGFLHSPATVIGFVRDTAKGQAKRYLGHNPVGGWMVVLLLVMLGFTAITGLLQYGTDELVGPLGRSGEVVILNLEGWHAFCANFTLLLVVIHLAGVAAGSLLQRESLVWAMITGVKPETTGPSKRGRFGRDGALIAGLLVIFGGFALGIMGGADRVHADTGEGDPVDTHDLEGLVPLEVILDKAKARHDGELIEAELKKINGVVLYEAEILDDQGKVWEMNFNAKTGELVTQQEDKNATSGR